MSYWDHYIIINKDIFFQKLFCKIINETIFHKKKFETRKRNDIFWYGKKIHDFCSKNHNSRNLQNTKDSFLTDFWTPMQKKNLCTKQGSFTHERSECVKNLVECKKIFWARVQLKRGESTIFYSSDEITWLFSFIHMSKKNQKKLVTFSAWAKRKQSKSAV